MYKLSSTLGQTKFKPKDKDIKFSEMHMASYIPGMSTFSGRNQVTESVTESTPKPPNTPKNLNINQIVTEEANKELLTAISEMEDLAAISASGLKTATKTIATFNNLVKSISSKFYYLEGPGACAQLKMNVSGELKIDYLRKIFAADELYDSLGTIIQIDLARAQVLACIRAFMIDNSIHPSKVIKQYPAPVKNHHFEGDTQEEDDDGGFQDSREFTTVIQSSQPERPGRAPKPFSQPTAPNAQTTTATVSVDSQLTAIMLKLNSNAGQLSELITVKKQVGANSSKIAEVEALASANKRAIAEIRTTTNHEVRSPNQSSSSNHYKKSLEKMKLKRKVQMREYFVRKGALTRNGTLQFKIFKDAPNEYFRADNLEMSKYHVIPEVIMDILGINCNVAIPYSLTPGRTIGGFENNGTPGHFKVDCNAIGFERTPRAHSEVDFATYLITNKTAFPNIRISRTIDFIDAAAAEVFNRWRFDDKIISSSIINKHGKYTFFFTEMNVEPADFLTVRCPLNLAELENATADRIKKANLPENWVCKGEIVELGDDRSWNANNGNRYGATNERLDQR